MSECKRCHVYAHCTCICKTSPSLSRRYVGVGMPSKAEERSTAAQAQALGETDAVGGQVIRGDRFGAVMGESFLRVADCSPVRAWAYLLGALPKVCVMREDCRVWASQYWRWCCVVVYNSCSIIHCKLIIQILSHMACVSTTVLLVTC